MTKHYFNYWKHINFSNHFHLTQPRLFKNNHPLKHTFLKTAYYPVAFIIDLQQFVNAQQTKVISSIVNREEGLEGGGVAKSCYCSISRDNTSASKPDSVI